MKEVALLREQLEIFAAYAGSGLLDILILILQGYLIKNKDMQKIRIRIHHFQLRSMLYILRFSFSFFLFRLTVSFYLKNIEKWHGPYLSFGAGLLQEVISVSLWSKSWSVCRSVCQLVSLSVGLYVCLCVERCFVTKVVQLNII